MILPLKNIPRRVLVTFVLAGATVTAAGAATYHRFAVSQSTGSGGATNFVQSATSSSALEGNVGTADTTYGTPFGVFGVYDTTGTTFGIGVLGASSTGYGIAGESLSDTQPSILAYPGGKGIGLEATTISSSTNPAILSESKGTGDGIDGAATNASAIAGIRGDDLSNGGEFTDGVYGTTTNGGYGGTRCFRRYCTRRRRGLGDRWRGRDRAFGQRLWHLRRFDHRKGGVCGEQQHIIQWGKRCECWSQRFIGGW